MNHGVYTKLFVNESIALTAVTQQWHKFTDYNIINFNNPALVTDKIRQLHFMIRHYTINPGTVLHYP